MKIRVGFGFDVHQLADGEDFILGGIHIPHSKGTFGHSDADVLIHTICDALLGAPSDNQFKGIDSKILLRDVVKILADKGYKISNIDSTVALEQPKINPHIPAMKKVLAECMAIDEDDLSIKATTTERLGFEGRQEGVSAYAAVLIFKD